MGYSSCLRRRCRLVCGPVVFAVAMLLLTPLQAHSQWAFRCPADGTAVTRVVAGKTITWTYKGPDPANPESCLASNIGRTYSFIFGLVDKNSRFASDYADAFRKIFSGPPGTTAQFRLVQYDGVNYIYRISNETFETLRIGGEDRQTIRIAESHMALGPRGFVVTWRRWIDVQTGALLRNSYQQEGGSLPLNPPANQDWTATNITVPR